VWRLTSRTQEKYIKCVKSFPNGMAAKDGECEAERDIYKACMRKERGLPPPAPAAAAPTK